MVRSHKKSLFTPMLSISTNTHRVHHYNHSFRNTLNSLASLSLYYSSGNSLSLDKPYLFFGCLQAAS